MSIQYKYVNQLTQSNDAKFDTLHSPGAPTPQSGVYTCHACGKEMTSIVGHTLPPQNHHQHSPGQGPIQWRLAVWG